MPNVIASFTSSEPFSQRPPTMPMRTTEITAVSARIVVISAPAPSSRPKNRSRVLTGLVRISRSVFPDRSRAIVR